jgi:hypothetical protein
VLATLAPWRYRSTVRGSTAGFQFRGELRDDIEAVGRIVLVGFAGCLHHQTVHARDRRHLRFECAAVIRQFAEHEPAELA